MRLFRLLIVAVLVSVFSIKAQNKFTLDEAIQLAYKNNIEIQKQTAAIKNAEAKLEGTQRLPNPSFAYYREDLELNNNELGEWVATGSIPLNFLWERWSNIDAKKKSVEAQKLLLENTKLNIASQVQEIYFDLHYYSLLSQDFKNTLTKLDELSRSAKHRLDEGDISEYELQRILIELNKLRSEANNIELQKNNFRNKLGLIIGAGDKEFNTTEVSENKNEITYSKDELINTAFQNRNDLKSIRILVESETSFLSHNKLKAIPIINLSAGYKEQTDSFKGSVVQLDFEIPLFKRNQVEIEQTEIQLDILSKEIKYLKEKIRAEVSESYDKYKINNTLFYERKDFRFHNIFSTAAYSYEQGEISLVEFIDGMNAHIEGMKLFNEIEMNYMKSISELERAVAAPLTNIENKSN